MAGEPQHDGAVPLPVSTGGCLKEKGGWGEGKRTPAGKFTSGEAQLAVKLRVAIVDQSHEHAEGPCRGGSGAQMARQQVSFSELECWRAQLEWGVGTKRVRRGVQWVRASASKGVGRRFHAEARCGHDHLDVRVCGSRGQEVEGGEGTTRWGQGSVGRRWHAQRAGEGAPTGGARRQRARASARGARGLASTSRSHRSERGQKQV